MYICYNIKVMIKTKRKINFNVASQIALGFLGVILIGSFLLCLPISSKDGTWLNFIDSLFTSTSAVCVTGLIVVDTAVHFSLFGQIVIMLLIQIGGLGFITLTSLIFVLIGKKISYQNRVALKESLNQETTQGIVRLLKNIIILVFSIEFVGFLLLAPSMISLYGWGNGIFRALFFAVSAFCNAGFDVIGTTETQFQSLTPLAQNAFVLLPIMALIVIGGIGYIVLLEIGGKFKKDKKKLSIHSKLVISITLTLIFGGAVLFAILEWNNPNTIGNMNFIDKIINSFFQSITPRTAGFATFDQSKLTPASQVITDLLMFIGGSPASTAGGIKTTTLFILLVAIFKNSNSKGDYIVAKKRVSFKVIQKCLKVAFLALLLIISSSIIICIAEGNAITFDVIIYELISAISTVGLTLGITPTLGWFSKFILALLMFIGRVGALTLTVALSSKTKNINEDIEYPDSKIIVG